MTAAAIEEIVVSTSEYQQHLMEQAKQAPALRPEQITTLRTLFGGAR